MGSRTHIITHRGLDPSRKPYFAESSREAFADQLSRGYGLEFDPLWHNNRFIVAHDEDFSRITQNGCHSISLTELLALIGQKQPNISALHLKHRLQEPVMLDRLLIELEAIDTSRLIIFDVTTDTARYIRKKKPSLILAPSVAHSYDIERFNSVTGGTLLSAEDVLENCDLFDWVWLDEWDRVDRDGKQKTFYTKETLTLFHDAGLNIGLVTPELHATSPHLLGGEAHEDAKDYEILTKRIREILELEPDAVCTDYPDAVRTLAAQISLQKIEKKT